MLWTKCTESLKRGSGRVSLYSCLKFSCLLQTLCKRRFSIIMIFFQNLLVATNKVLDIEQLSIISPVSSQEPAFIDFIKIALHNSVTHFVHRYSMQTSRSFRQIPALFLPEILEFSRTFFARFASVIRDFSFICSRAVTISF